MARSHTHWPDGKGPTCKFETKRECDEFFREWKRQAKTEHDQKVETRKTAERERQQAAADAFIAKEWARMVAEAAREEPAVDQIIEQWSRTRMPDVSGRGDSEGQGPTRVQPRGVSGLRRHGTPATNQP